MARSAGARAGKVSGRVARLDRERAVRKWGPVGVLVAVAAVGALVLATAGLPAGVVPAGTADCTSDSPGQDACPFVVPLINRQASFDLAGSSGPMLIEFMGSHCTTCERQMDDLTQVASTYRPQGLDMVSLDVGGVLGTENPQDAIDFMARNGGDWDIALDNDAIAIDYGVVTLPTIFLVDSGGKIVYRTGFISAAKLSEQIEPLL